MEQQHTPDTEGSGKPLYTPKKSILWRTVRHTCTMTATTALLLSVTAFLAAYYLLEQRVFTQLASVANTKEQLIDQRIAADREHAAVMATRPGVKNVLLRDEGKAVLQDLLFSMQEEGSDALGIAVFGEQNDRRAEVGMTVRPPGETVTATKLVPLFSREGWKGYVVYSPIRGSDGTISGTVGIHYSTRALVSAILSPVSLRESGEVLLGQENEQGKINILNHQVTSDVRMPLSVGMLRRQHAAGLPIARALAREEGQFEGTDYRGQQVFASYRSIPTLGWGLVVKEDRRDAMEGVWFLGATLALKSVLLLCIALYLSVLLARRLTGPLLHLSEKMRTLGPGNWQFRRSVDTEDEVELLDRVVADMAGRLRKIYDKLEEMVRNRTRELREQYLRDRVILESIDHGVLLVDEEGAVTQANPAARTMLGCSEEDCEGKPVQSVFAVRQHHKPLKGGEHPVYRALSEGETVEQEPGVWHNLIRADQTLVPIHLTVNPLLQEGTVQGAVVVFRDVTEERRVDYLKSEFISLASHQLRTPLSTVQWYLELFEDEMDELSGPQGEYLSAIETATHRMTKLIDALLHAARLEGGTIVPKTQNVDVAQLLRELGEELRASAQEKRLTCTVDVPEEPVYVHTDSVLLHVVFKNLFSNAVKYTQEEGEVGVRLRKQGEEVLIDVHDSGIGIPGHEQHRLFERLFRAENVRKIDTTGSGLGLYISHMIVDSLGGTIDAESTEGEGSTFTVRLPLSSEDEQTEESEDGTV